MRTGELARRAGVNVETLRFYERKQLLREPLRSPSGYRSYTEEDLAQVLFIRDCQALGFTLIDIQELIQLHGFFAHADRSERQSRRGERLMAIARERLRAIEGKLQTLGRMRDNLLRAVAQSDARHAPVCPARARQD